jgi:hypothetical protein
VVAVSFHAHEVESGCLIPSGERNRLQVSAVKRDSSVGHDRFLSVGAGGIARRPGDPRGMEPGGKPGRPG